MLHVGDVPGSLFAISSQLLFEIRMVSPAKTPPKHVGCERVSDLSSQLRLADVISAHYGLGKDGGICPRCSHIGLGEDGGICPRCSHIAKQVGPKAFRPVSKRATWCYARSSTVALDDRRWSKT